MIFDRILIRFRRDLLYRSLFCVIKMIMSGFILISDLYYISFFGGGVFDMAFGRIPSRIYKDIRSNYIEF